MWGKFSNAKRSAISVRRSAALDNNVDELGAVCTSLLRQESVCVTSTSESAVTRSQVRMLAEKARRQGAGQVRQTFGASGSAGSHNSKVPRITGTPLRDTAALLLHSVSHRVNKRLRLEIRALLSVLPSPQFVLIRIIVPILSFFFVSHPFFFVFGVFPPAAR